QLGQFIAAPAPAMPQALAAAQHPELAESLAVCFVTAAQVADPPKDLSVLVRPSGSWHHQVRSAGGTTHMARSTRPDFAGDDLQVEQWVASPVAAKLDGAIVWVDEEHPDDDVTVRLLGIPAYYL